MWENDDEDPFQISSDEEGENQHEQSDSGVRLLENGPFETSQKQKTFFGLLTGLKSEKESKLFQAEMDPFVVEGEVHREKLKSPLFQSGENDPFRITEDRPKLVDNDNPFEIDNDEPEILISDNDRKQKPVRLLGMDNHTLQVDGRKSKRLLFANKDPFELRNTQNEEQTESEFGTDNRVEADPFEIQESEGSGENREQKKSVFLSPKNGAAAITPTFLEDPFKVGEQEQIDLQKDNMREWKLSPVIPKFLERESNEDVNQVQTTEDKDNTKITNRIPATFVNSLGNSAQDLILSDPEKTEGNSDIYDLDSILPSKRRDALSTELQKEIEQEEENLDEEFEDDFVESPHSDPVMITEAASVIPNSGRTKSRVSAAKTFTGEYVKAAKRQLPKNLPFSLNDRIARQAMENIGIRKDDICYPSELDLNAYTRDPELRESVRRRLCQNVDNLVAEVEEEMNRIEKKQRAVEKRSDNTHTFGRSEEEMAQLRHKRQIEAILLGALKQKYTLQQEQQREQMELERKQLAEQELKRKQRLASEKRQRIQEQLQKRAQEREERLAELRRLEGIKEEEQQRRKEFTRRQHQLESTQREEERKRKMESVRRQREEQERKRVEEAAKKLQDIDSRSEERIQRLENEKIMVRQERLLSDIQYQKMRQQLERKEKNRQQLLLKQTEQRQQRIDETMQAIELERQARAAKMKSEEKRKQEHTRKIREQFEQKRLEAQDNMNIKQRLSEALVKAQELEKEKKALEMRQEYDATVKRWKQKQREQDKLQQERIDRLEQEECEKERRKADIQKQMNHERTKQVLDEQMRRVEKQFALERKQRLQQLRNDRESRELAERMEEHKEEDRVRARALAERNRRIHILSGDGEQSANELLASLKDSEFEGDLLQQLASKYGVDLETLEQKALERPGGYLSAQNE